MPKGPLGVYIGAAVAPGTTTTSGATSATTASFVLGGFLRTLSRGPVSLQVEALFVPLRRHSTSTVGGRSVSTATQTSNVELPVLARVALTDRSRRAIAYLIAGPSLYVRFCTDAIACSGSGGTAVGGVAGVGVDAGRATATLRYDFGFGGMSAKGAPQSNAWMGLLGWRW